MLNQYSVNRFKPCRRGQWINFNCFVSETASLAAENAVLYQGMASAMPESLKSIGL